MTPVTRLGAARRPIVALPIERSPVTQRSAALEQQGGAVRCRTYAVFSRHAFWGKYSQGASAYVARSSPPALAGLAAALGALAQATAEVAALRLDLTIDVVLPTLPPDSEQAIYRTAQEALANVNYHAGASHLTVALTAAPGMIQLLVQDDGRGFQPDTPVTVGHYGLAGMAEWAQITGGRLTVTSAPNQGTTVRADIGA
jgi:hypothetical protein